MDLLEEIELERSLTRITTLLLVFIVWNALLTVGVVVLITVVFWH